MFSVKRHTECLPLIFNINGKRHSKILHCVFIMSQGSSLSKFYLSNTVILEFKPSQKPDSFSGHFTERQRLTRPRRHLLNILCCVVVHPAASFHLLPVFHRVGEHSGGDLVYQSGRCH